jgi:hypothetical protein
MHNVVVSSPPLLQTKISDDDDIVRVEESWTIESEVLLQHWAIRWGLQEDAHIIASLFKRRLYYWIAIPTTIIPLATVPLTTPAVVDMPHVSIVITIALVVTAALSGIASMFRFDKAHADHENAAFRYADLISDVEEILSKRRKFRPDVDMTVSNLKIRSDTLKRYSPDVSIYESVETLASQV